MDIKALDEMINQYNILELRLVDFINNENAQFEETEEMKILQAYSDTSRVLIHSMRKELLNSHRCDIRDLNAKDIQTHHKAPEYLLASLRRGLNEKYGVSGWKAKSQFFKDLDKIINM